MRGLLLVTVLALALGGCVKPRSVVQPVGTAPAAASPAPSVSLYVFPGRVYAAAEPFCAVLPIEAFTPGIYSGPPTLRDYKLSVNRANGHTMRCGYKVETGPATGSGDIEAYSYPDAAGANAHFDQRKQFYIGPRNYPSVREELPGLGTRAAVEYRPVTRSTNPKIRVTPGRDYRLLVMDENLVLEATILSLRPLDTEYPDSDADYRAKIHQLVRALIARLRT